jgi:hypothetical protein
MGHSTRRILGFAFAMLLPLGAGLLAAAPQADASGSVTTVVLDAADASQAGAAATNTVHYIGKGAWEAVLGTKMELYIDPSQVAAFGGKPILISDIQSISYETNTPVAVSGENAPDFSMNIYTQKYSGDSGHWYGQRLSAEPYLSRDLTSTANEWDTWTTNAGPNQLTFYDTNNNGGTYGQYEEPTLQDLQAEPVDWSNYFASGNTIDYRGQAVKYFEFGTGSGWDATFQGYIDAINITLTDGTSVTFDLEKDAPPPPPPPLRFLDITTAVSDANPVPTVIQNPTGTVGQFLFDVLHSQGGVGFGDWTYVSGDVPPGLSVDVSGAIIGVPTEAGTYTFTVQVTDLAENTATQEITMVITSPK